MLALSDTPTKDNSPVTEMVYSVESAADGVFSVTAQTRYNSAGEPLSATQKQLISQLSGTIENKSVFVSERSLTSAQWTEYSGGTKRVQYSTVPTSSITAETVTVDGDIDFQPEYDADGNQTRVKTGTGIWAISYDAENRPTDFSSQAADGTITTVHCEYDYMGRRTTKIVTEGNNVTMQQRYIYRGYLQVACIDLTLSHHPALWFITWDPTQPVATRPLAIQKGGTWYTYGWDLTKNVCEVYGQHGYIRTAYTYTPYGQVTAEGDVEQNIQWSSEFNDTELGLIYYNYRHYNPVNGRWIGRDKLQNKNLYRYLTNDLWSIDVLGAKKLKIEIFGYDTPDVRFVKPGIIPAELGKNALVELMKGTDKAAATTQVLINKNDINIVCKKCNSRFIVDVVKIKASIIVLINERRYTNKYYDARYDAFVELDHYYSYIPTNDGRGQANEDEVMAGENDHVNDFQTWLSSAALREKLTKGLDSIRYFSYRRCLELSREYIERIMINEYNLALNNTIMKYDYGDKPKHALTPYMPTLLDGLWASTMEKFSEMITETINKSINH